MRAPITTSAFSLEAINIWDHFTQAAGPVAIRPVAEALKDERFCVAWRLRHEGFLGFGCDPDGVLSDEADGFGFRR